MNASKGFPLLRLPNVALHEVLSTMNPLELIFLSKTSLRAKKAAKFFSKQKPISQYLVDLNFENPSFQIKGTLIKLQYNFRLNEDRDELLENEDDHYYYSEDPITDLMNYAGYVMEVFSWPVRSVFVAFDKFEERNKSITDWLKIYVKSTKVCHLTGEIISDEYASYFLRNIQITWCLHLCSEMSYNYRLNLPQYIQYIDIHESDFITFDQLTSFDVKYITLRNTRITNQELNQFLKNWMTSKCNINLHNFHIHIQNRHSWDIIIADLPNAEKLNQAMVQALGYTRKMEGFDIKRNDGTAATIYLEVQNDEDWNLSMLVW